MTKLTRRQFLGISLATMAYLISKGIILKNAAGFLLRTDAPGTGDGEGMIMTFLIAANNALASTKAKADYVCDGTNDQAEIQAAHDALPAGAVIAMRTLFILTTKLLIYVRDLVIRFRSQ